MNCEKCSSKIHLVQTKDKETGMHFNYWNCDSCGKTEPNGPVTVFVQNKVNFADVDSLRRQIDPRLGKDGYKYKVEYVYDKPKDGK